MKFIPFALTSQGKNLYLPLFSGIGFLRILNFILFALNFQGKKCIFPLFSGIGFLRILREKQRFSLNLEEN